MHSSGKPIHLHLFYSSDSGLVNLLRNLCRKMKEEENGKHHFYKNSKWHWKSYEFVTKIQQGFRELILEQMIADVDMLEKWL